MTCEICECKDLSDNMAIYTVRLPKERKDLRVCKRHMEPWQAAGYKIDKLKD